MDALFATPLYAALLTVIFLILSVRVIAERRSNRIAYGDNDSPRIHAKIRAQANWAEYAPIGLLLILVAELQGIGIVWLHLMGIILTLGRALHGYGMSFNPKELKFRAQGMLLTLTALGLGLILVIVGLIF